MPKILRNLLLWILIPSRKYFFLFFKFFSLILNSKIKISFTDGYYYIKNIKLRFYHRKAGVYFYLLRINRRISFLKKYYLLLFKNLYLNQ